MCKCEEKIKVTEAFVIVEEREQSAGDVFRERYYFSIKYKMVGEENYTVGFSSYYVDTVFKWLYENFEIVKEEQKETDDTETSDWWCCKTDDDIKELKTQIKNINKKIDRISNYVIEEDTKLKQAFMQGNVSHSVFASHCIRKMFLDESIDK